MIGCPFLAAWEAPPAASSEGASRGIAGHAEKPLAPAPAP